jgi:hypothetical protein
VVIDGQEKLKQYSKVSPKQGSGRPPAAPAQAAESTPATEARPAASARRIHPNGQQPTAADLPASPTGSRP